MNPGSIGKFQIGINQLFLNGIKSINNKVNILKDNLNHISKKVSENSQALQNESETMLLAYENEKIKIAGEELLNKKETKEILKTFLKKHASIDKDRKSTARNLVVASIAACIFGACTAMIGIGFIFLVPGLIGLYNGYNKSTIFKNNETIIDKIIENPSEYINSTKFFKAVIEMQKKSAEEKSEDKINLKKENILAEKSTEKTSSDESVKKETAQKSEFIKTKLLRADLTKNVIHLSQDKVNEYYNHLHAKIEEALFASVADESTK